MISSLPSSDTQAPMGRIKHVMLYVSTDYVIAYRIPRRAHKPAEFIAAWPWLVEGLLPEGLESFLTQHATSHYQILADFPEEEFHVETMPPLHGRDLDQLLQRKLVQRFRDTPLRAAWLTEPSRWIYAFRGYPANAVILSGLVLPSALLTLFKAFEERQAVVTGVRTTTHLYAALASMFEEQKVLLVGVHPAGLRLVYVQAGVPCFARLAVWPNAAFDPLQESGASSMAGELAAQNEAEFLAQIDRAAALPWVIEEIQKTLQYLQIGRFVERDQLNPNDIGVKILMAGPAQSAAAEPGRWPNGNPLIPTWQPLTDFGSQPFPPSAGQHGLLTLATLFQRRWLERASQRYYPPRLTQRWYLKRLARQIYIGAGCGVVLALLWAAWQLPHWLSNQAQITDNQQQQQLALQRYEKIKAAFPSLPLPAEAMQQRVDLFNQLQARGISIEMLFQTLSQALDRHEQINLKKISWLPPVTAQEANSQLLGEGTGDMPMPNPETPEAESATAVLQQVVQLEGTVLTQGQALSKQATNRLVQAFADSLAQGCRCQLAVKRFVYDENPAGVVAGRVGSANEALPSNEFILTLRWSLRPNGASTTLTGAAQ
ncbi:hypothetical protein DU000_11410 [Parvibium lacunae]|uniref:Uncharacterized protein n=2 Tax=Parvibium lacunae TaxID=1888893 RepID=A0A368KYT7_9BURK|nr:hypothetical protein DU000_11410 [Parvibium lacunae]